MSGRIVRESVVIRGHECTPPRAPDGQRPNPSSASGCPQHLRSDYPDGTVWECDCDKTWVTKHGCWRPERWWARWLRKRRGPGDPRAGRVNQRWHGPGIYLLDDVNVHDLSLPTDHAARWYPG